MDELRHRLRHRLNTPVANRQQRQAFKPGQRRWINGDPSPYLPPPPSLPIGPRAFPIPCPHGFQHVEVAHGATVLRPNRPVSRVRRDASGPAFARRPAMPPPHRYLPPQPPTRPAQPPPIARRASQHPLPRRPPSAPTHQAAILPAAAPPPAPPPPHSAAPPRREGSETRQRAPSPPRIPAGSKRPRACQRHPGHRST